MSRKPRRPNVDGNGLDLDGKEEVKKRSVDPGDPRSDEDLFHAARRSDVEALGVLYVRCWELGWRWTGSGEEVRDILQDWFVDILEGLPDLVVRKRFRTYLCGVIQNKSRAHRRTMRREKEVLRERERERDRCVEAEDGQGGVTDEFASLLADLTPRQEEVLRHVYWQDRTVAQTAEALGVSVGAVKSRLHNAREALRRKLEKKNSKNKGAAPNHGRDPGHNTNATRVLANSSTQRRSSCCAHSPWESRS